MSERTETTHTPENTHANDAVQVHRAERLV